MLPDIKQIGTQTQHAADMRASHQTLSTEIDIFDSTLFADQLQCMTCCLSHIMLHLTELVLVSILNRGIIVTHSTLSNFKQAIMWQPRVEFPFWLDSDSTRPPGGGVRPCSCGTLISKWWKENIGLTEGKYQDHNKIKFILVGLLTISFVERDAEL